MQDSKTRRLLIFVIMPAATLPFTGSLHVSDFARGLTYGLVIGIQLLLVLKLKQHRMSTDNSSS